MNTEPAIGDLVGVRDEEGRELASRIEDIDGARVTVARPLNLPLEHRFDAGLPLYITSRQPNGILVRPGFLTDKVRQRNMGLWVVELDGTPWREQRRAFVRAAITAPVHLSWQAPKLEQTTEDVDTDSDVDAAPVFHEADGMLADLSEGALRCSAPEALIAELDGLSTGVHIDFSVDGRDFALDGELLCLRHNSHDPHRRDVVVQFTAPRAKADQLRKLVFERQLLGRQVA